MSHRGRPITTGQLFAKFLKYSANRVQIAASTLIFLDFSAKIVIGHHCVSTFSCFHVL